MVDRLISVVRAQSGRGTRPKVDGPSERPFLGTVRTTMVTYLFLPMFKLQHYGQNTTIGMRGIRQ